MSKCYKAPDFKVLENYGSYKQIKNVNELLDESGKHDNLALHCAEWNGKFGYFHHYILFISNESENIKRIRKIEKANKDWRQLVPASAICFRSSILFNKSEIH